MGPARSTSTAGLGFGVRACDVGGHLRLSVNPVAATAAVRTFIGHAKISTTERYLHARSRCTDAARLTKAFVGERVPDFPVERV